VQTEAYKLQMLLNQAAFKKEATMIQSIVQCTCVQFVSLKSVNGSYANIRLLYEPLNLRRNLENACLHNTGIK